jgi:hypothetical protein
MNEQKDRATAQQAIENTKIRVPAGMYNVLELYKFIDELHLRMGQQSIKGLGDE